MTFKQVLFVSFLVVAAAEIYQSENLEISGRLLQGITVLEKTVSGTDTESVGLPTTTSLSEREIKKDNDSFLLGRQLLNKVTIKVGSETETFNADGTIKTDSSKFSMVIDGPISEEVMKACAKAACTIMDKVRSPTFSLPREFLPPSRESLDSNN